MMKLILSISKQQEFSAFTYLKRQFFAPSYYVFLSQNKTRDILETQGATSYYKGTSELNLSYSLATSELLQRCTLATLELLQRCSKLLPRNTQQCSAMLSNKIRDQKRIFLLIKLNAFFKKLMPFSLTKSKNQRCPAFLCGDSKNSS